MGLAFSATTKGRFVIQRRTNPNLPWVDVQGCQDGEAAETLLSWFREHHSGPIGNIEYRLLDAHDIP